MTAKTEYLNKMANKNLKDLTEDALLLILEKLILDTASLENLKRSCKFFNCFFSTYHRQLVSMRHRALESAWMRRSEVLSSSVKVPLDLNPKESLLVKGEEAQSGGVIFLAACSSYIVMVRYNEQDGVVCACPALKCGCEKQVDSEARSKESSNSLFARKRLEVWSTDMYLLRVVSSETFGHSFTTGGRGPEGNWPRFQFWSGARVRSPIFAYDVREKVVVWVESQALEIEINLYFVEKGTTSSVKIERDPNSYSECLPRAVSMHKGILLILYEKGEENELFLRFYNYTKFLSEFKVSDLEHNLVQYSNFIVDQNTRFGVVAFSTWVRGVPRAVATSITSVKVGHGGTDGAEVVSSRDLCPVQAYISGVSMSPSDDLVATLDSTEAGHPLVRLLLAATLEEVAVVNMPEFTLPPTTEPYRGGIMWHRNILIVVIDQLVENLEEHVGRGLVRLAVRTTKGGEVTVRKEALDFWPGVWAAHHEADPEALAPWRRERESQHLEAVAMVEAGLVTATRNMRGDSLLATIHVINPS